MLIIYLLVIPLAIFCREEVAQELTFIPAYFYLGDDVILNFWISSSPNDVLDIGIYPQNKNLIIQEVILNSSNQRTYVTVRFKSFFVGTQHLSLSLRDISVSNIPITTRSLISEGYDQARTIYTPKLLNYTYLFIIITTVSIILIIPTSILTVRITNKMIHYYKERTVIPYRIFIKTITQLIRSESQLNDAQYYSQLNNAVKIYLTQHLKLNSLTSATPQEVETILSPFFEEESRKKLAKILQRSDTIRFGGRFAEVGERESDTSFVLLLAKNSEKQKNETQQ